MEYYVLNDKKTSLIRFDIVEGKIENFGVFDGLDWVYDYDLKEVAEKLVKYNLLGNDSVVRKLAEEDLEEFISEKIAQKLDPDHPKTKKFNKR